MATVNRKACVNRILVKGSSVTGVRALIEVRLGVKTYCGPWVGSDTVDDPKWYIDFTTDKKVDLDFLIPDVLPPKIK